VVNPAGVWRRRSVLLRRVREYGLRGLKARDRMIFVASAVLALPALLAFSEFGRPISILAGPWVRPATRSRQGREELLGLAACSCFRQQMPRYYRSLAGRWHKSEGNRSALIMSALVVVPQIIVALLAPWTGRRAESWGRRPLLLIGFGALPIRAVLFVLITDPAVLIALQALDGISGTVLGVLSSEAD
jgi:hypothetical protein